MIPALTQEELERRFAIAKPLVHCDKTYQYYLRNIPLEKVANTAYTWDRPDPAVDQFVGSSFMQLHHICSESRAEILAKQAESRDGSCTMTGTWDCIDTLPTLHTWAYYGFFKPTVKEVLAQIPKGFFDKHASLLFSTAPAGDLNSMTIGGYHVGRTYVYAPRKKLKDPQLQPWKDGANPLPLPKRAKCSETAEPDEEEKTAFPQCSICQDAPADTIALPYVAIAVSAVAAATAMANQPNLPDHSVCVQCRKPIVSVDTPDGIVQIK
jgi:hypothetical protein